MVTVVESRFEEAGTSGGTSAGRTREEYKAGDVEAAFDWNTRSDEELWQDNDSSWSGLLGGAGKGTKPDTMVELER